MLGLRKIETQFVRDALEKTVRCLDQDAGPVAGFRVGPGSAAVPEIDENLERLLDKLVIVRTVDVGNHSNATGVTLKSRVVQTCLSHLFEMFRRDRCVARR